MRAAGRVAPGAAQECRESQPEEGRQREFAFPNRGAEEPPGAGRADLQAERRWDAVLREYRQRAPPVRQGVAEYAQRDAEQEVAGCPERDARWAYRGARKAPEVLQGKAHAVRTGPARDEA